MSRRAQRADTAPVAADLDAAIDAAREAARRCDTLADSAGRRAENLPTDDARGRDHLLTLVELARAAAMETRAAVDGIAALVERRHT